jgi:hypothetical protein
MSHRRSKKAGGDPARGEATAGPSPAPGPDPVRGMAPPAQLLGRFLPLYYPGVGGMTQAVILSDHLFAWGTHHYQGRTYPHCVEPPGACEGCRCGQRLRWTAWAHALAHPSARHVLYQITGEAYLSCPELARLDGALRGQLLELRRKGEGRQGRVYARLLPYTIPADLPPAVDVRPRLDRLWDRVDGWLEAQCGPYPRGLNPPGEGKESDG